MEKSVHSPNSPVFANESKAGLQSGQEVIKLICNKFETFCRNEIIEVINPCNSAQNDEIQRIFALDPDVVSLQNVPNNAEELISIPGYESIFFTSQYSDFGVVTLWNPEKLSLVKSFKLDFYLKNQQPNNSSGLIIILHTKSKHRICVVNCTLSENDKASRVQLYFLLRILNRIRGEADQLIIFGVSHGFFKVLCVDGDFLGYSRNVLEELKRVVGKEKENSLKIYLGNGEKFNEFFRFSLLKVEKTAGWWVYYLGRLSLRRENEVIYIESRG